MKRHWIRIAVFLLAAVLALQIFPWPRGLRAWLSISPLLSVLGALAARSAYLWLLLGIPVLVLGWFRSRWFCRYACPVGLATETVGRLNPRARGRFTRIPRLGRGALLLLAGGALCGYPLFIWLDPLSLFNGFWSVWRVPPTRTAFALALGFPLVLLLSLLVPQAWCHRCCPLGALQDLLAGFHKAWGLRAAAATGPDLPLPLTRRAFLGAAVGGAAALLMRRGAAAPPPIRPPGAQPEDQFTGLCARCGACIRACPYGILQPALGEGGLAGLLAPAIDYSKAHCFEYCHECTKACPTGAIGRLTLEAKRNRALGLAVVTREKCIAWREGQYCMVCHEFCPYLAIEGVAHNGVNCPVVLPEMCRGCGACQVNCPARPDKAIVVQGAPQRPVRPLADVVL